MILRKGLCPIKAWLNRIRSAPGDIVIREWIQDSDEFTWEAVSWETGLSWVGDFRPQFVPGMERPWEAGIGLGFVMKSLNVGLILRIPGVSFRLLSVGDKMRVAFTGSLPQMGRRGELTAYEDWVCFLPGQPIFHLFINLFFHLTFIFSLWLLKLCLKTRGCLLITILWVFEGENREGKMWCFVASL